MTAADARAFWISAPGHGELRAETLPPPGQNDVIVRALPSSREPADLYTVVEAAAPGTQ